MRTLRRLRYRLARLLAGGSYALIPDRDGVWVVIREGPALATLETEQFYLRRTAIGRRAGWFHGRLRS